MGDSRDVELIHQTVEHYFKGMYHGDIEKLKKAFHPTALVIGYFDGNLVFNSLEQFLGFIKAAPVPSEKGEEYDMRIVSMDVTGSVATVKVADLYQGRRFTDYLSMVKEGDNWVIINKAFHHEPRQ